jgi:hypothetical protein
MSQERSDTSRLVYGLGDLRITPESQGFLTNQLVLHLAALACSFDLPLELRICIGQRAYAGSQDR